MSKIIQTKVTYLNTYVNSVAYFMLFSLIDFCMMSCLEKNRYISLRVSHKTHFIFGQYYQNFNHSITFRAKTVQFTGITSRREELVVYTVIPNFTTICSVLSVTKLSDRHVPLIMYSFMPLLQRTNKNINTVL
jgi:hypothetical protein